MRIDASASRVFVGYGKGALAVIDAPSYRKVADIPLKGHPESFQLDPATGRAFVNVPDAGHVAVMDIASGRPLATWQVPGLRSNFPMTLALGDPAPCKGKGTRDLAAMGRRDQPIRPIE